MGHPIAFCVLSLFSNIFTQKLVVSRGIQTWIIAEEGEYANPLDHHQGPKLKV